MCRLRARSRRLRGLPRWTEMPTGHGFCLYMRGQVLDLVGSLDPIFSPGYGEENDWVMRAQAMGFVAKRANRAFVYHLGRQSFRNERLKLEQRNALLLAERHPHYRPQVQRFYDTLDARLAAHAVRVDSSGKLRVALDLRHLSPDKVGTATYSIGLARALSALPEIELTMVVRQPRQAAGVPGRLVAEERLLANVEVVHKPAQVFDPADLTLLFQSPAHTVITHLDLIAHRARRSSLIRRLPTAIAPQGAGGIGRPGYDHDLGARSARDHRRIRSLGRGGRRHPAWGRSELV